ncbi:hydroxymethylbilane synthase [Rhizobacter sp. OV335]|jgi:hydroxymethylbilane synthase|uniref:hydroxymethylbilane synthase n=1 Tax=Rhizobacter sp. OV335 TaxID=1500264 RepID=UPI00091A5608|nr:hydroxymethylbilane synthase [Rhizobacter sp. OV335]SHM30340.1 hydroxymethylbilane synthase [Rhizobacter sp. OV335]
MSSLPEPLVIATRESRLALWQAEHVRDLLQQRFGLRVELLGMTTRGDQILDRTLSKVGGKGLFVKELEAALEDGRAHLAVHSLKDVPMDLPDGFELAAVLEREDPRDAFVSNRFATLAELPQGACVGTSSLRRVSQVLARRPDLRIEPLRGNLDTRLRKLDDGQYDAIVLAAAGLKRLGLAQRIRSVFAVDEMIPAAGQGALGIEIRSDQPALRELLAQLSDRPTWWVAQAERAVSRSLGGSCSMPLAAHAVWDGAQLRITAALGHVDDPARPLLHTTAVAVVADDGAARGLGELAAAQLRSAGADAYLGTG